MLDDNGWMDGLDLLTLCEDDESCEPAHHHQHHHQQESNKVLGFEFGTQIDSPNAAYCKGLLEGLISDSGNGSSWGCSVIDGGYNTTTTTSQADSRRVRIQLPLTMESQERDAAITRIGVAFSSAPVREIVNTLEVDETTCKRLMERVGAVKEATGNHDSVKAKGGFSATILEADTSFTVANILQVFNSLRRSINSLANGRGGTIAYGVQNGTASGLSITRHPPDYLELLMHCATCLSSPQIDLSLLSMKCIPVQAQPNTYIYEITVNDARRWGYKPYYTDTTREVAYLCHTNGVVKPMPLEIQNEFKKRTFFQHFQGPTAADPPRVSLAPELYDVEYKERKGSKGVNDITTSHAGSKVDEATGELLATCAAGHPLLPCTGEVAASCQKKRVGCRRAIDKSVAALRCALCGYYVCDMCYEGFFKEVVAKASVEAKEASRDAGEGVKFLVAVLAKADPGGVGLCQFSKVMRQLCVTPGLLVCLALLLVHRSPSIAEWQELGADGVYCEEALIARIDSLAAKGPLPDDALNFAEITACISIPSVSQAASSLLAKLTPSPTRLIAVLSRSTPTLPPPTHSASTAIWSAMFSLHRHSVAYEAFFSLHSKHLKPLLPSFCEGYQQDVGLAAYEKIGILKEIAERSPTVQKRIVKYLPKLPMEIREVAW